jgi:hypothetical protein
MKYFRVLSLVLVSFCLLGMTGSQQTVVVPNVEGISLELAAHMLENVGLQSEGRPAVLTSLVVRQYPRPGFEVFEGTVVTLFTEEQSQPQSRTPRTSSTTILSPKPQISIQSTQSFPTSSVQGPFVGGGAEVTVIPIDSSVIQGPAYVQSPMVQPQNTSTIFYEPPQPRLSPYFIQNQTPRFYPAWYPKQFIPSTAPSTQGIMSVYAQSAPFQQTASPYTVLQLSPQYRSTAVTPGQSSIKRYPSIVQGGRGTIFVDSGTTTRVGLIETTTSPAVPVPSVVRLRQQYAVSALTRAGFFPGTIVLVDSDQLRSGYVVQQWPQARQLVPSGTRVQLWIAR